jgi:hypothetical protein
MNDLLQQLRQVCNQHPIALALTIIALVAVVAINIGRELEAAAWPHQWSFHHRIQFQRFEHAVPLFTYPSGGSNRFVPYLGTAHNLLRSGDSISKQLGADRFLLIRDSIGYRLTTQWAWNQTTRDFEFAGRTSARL